MSLLTRMWMATFMQNSVLLTNNIPLLLTKFRVQVE